MDNQTNKEPDVFVDTLLQEIANKAATIAQLNAVNHKLSSSLKEIQKEQSNLTDNHSK